MPLDPARSDAQRPGTDGTDEPPAGPPRRICINPPVVTLLYAALGALWIVVTDLVVEELFYGSTTYAVLQFAKGMLYVLFSALFVYWLSRRASRTLDERLTRERLATKERLLDAVLASLGEAVLVIDPPDRTIRRCNAAAERVFGYSGNELVGQCTEMLHVDRASFDEFARRGESALAKERIFRCEYRMKRRDGTVIDTYNVISPIHESQGWKEGVVSVVQDITDWKRAKQELQRREEQYRLLAENALDLIWSMDMDLRFTYVNPAIRDQMGYAPDEFIGTTLDRYCTPEEMQRIRTVIDNETTRAGAESGVLLETTMLHKDGTPVPVEVHGRVLFGPEGHPVGIQGTTRDISRRKEAERDLKVSERRFRTLFEQAAEGIVIADAETTEFLYANPAMSRILRYSQSELQHMQVRDIHPQDALEMVLDAFAAIMDGSHCFPKELPVVTKQGEIRYADITGAPMTINGRRCNVGFFRDVTERKRLDQQKRVLEAQLRQSQRLESLGVFAGGVAHEINNPIMGITGYADIIAQDAPEDSELLEHASAIKRETEKIHSLVRNLLTFARTDEERPPEPASVDALLEATLSLVRTIMRHDRIDLEVDVPDSLPSLLCRPRQIQQVLTNLLTNARDALNEKYPDAHENKRIRVVAKTFTKDHTQWVRLTVEDQGPGIPAEVREHMFEPLYTTKPEDVGTGLGMSIVHGIVTEHGGKIAVESSESEFTRIHVDLLAAPD